MCFNLTMINVLGINSKTTFGSQRNTQKREFIDIIADNVKNPRDVNDCVAVPRGIFKAYIYLMAGSGLISIANFLPQKLKGIKTTLNVAGASLGIISAVYFAKPFAVKGLQPTISQSELSPNCQK